MSPTMASGGLSLFPNTSATKPPSRKTTPKPRVSHSRGPSHEMSPSRNGRRTPEGLSEFIIDGSPQRAAGDSRVPSPPPHLYHESEAGPSVSRPVPPSEVPPRTDTAFSGATLVRGNSNRSRASIAKRPVDEISTSAPAEETAIRSMFPQYDHSRPLEQQNYFPTQTSPRHIPRTVISRQSHFSPEAEAQAQSPPPLRSPVRSPLSAGSAQQRWPRRNNDPPPVIPPVSKTEELRDYWKAANGWKASATEGRTYCLKLTPEKDTPVYTMSSATQPFYHLRIDPTSASARVTLSRHDPAKMCKDRDPQAAAARSPGILSALRDAESPGSGSGSASTSRPWQEVMNTTLEEPARRQRPNDGLVALLYPSAAARVALERPGDAAAVAAAENECARLVWDADSANYFLAHPALAAPFCVTIERNAAWSRTEYALEHVESPRHLARLTRESAGGAGAGFLELDTSVAARVEASYYILDVAVCALLLVAHLDERDNPAAFGEAFEPPPSFLQPPLPAHLREDGGADGDAAAAAANGGRSSMSSRLSGLLHGRGRGGEGGDEVDGRGRPKRGKKGKRSRLGRPTEEFEMDLESQSSGSLGGSKFHHSFSLSSKDKGGKDKYRERDKLPGPTRAAIKLLSLSFKCVIWALTILFKALFAVVVGLSKCVTSEKL